GLKIDAGLVAGAAARPDRAAAVEQALELARAVRLPAAAAGCDGPAEFDLLLQLGCRFAEGAFIAAPMDGDGVVAWAAGWQPPSVATT
ncbi:MAG: EAL domain-containing protein, partial [Solirubrobacteraceae bacterium]